MQEQLMNGFFVGNVMIDILLTNRQRFEKPEVCDELEL
jgi:hypothetical protein